VANRQTVPQVYDLGWCKPTMAEKRGGFGEMFFVFEYSELTHSVRLHQVDDLVKRNGWRQIFLPNCSISSLTLAYRTSLIVKLYT